MIKAKRQLDRARVPGGAITFVVVDVKRLDVDDAGEPRVLEGTSLVVGREPQLELVHA
jgi:hypothetical protein